MTRRLPDVNKQGVLCEGCSQRYLTELMIPNDLWKEICKGQDFLCGACIMNRLQESKESRCLITERVGNFKNPRSWRYTEKHVYRTIGY